MKFLKQRKLKEVTTAVRQIDSISDDLAINDGNGSIQQLRALANQATALAEIANQLIGIVSAEMAIEKEGK